MLYINLRRRRRHWHNVEGLFYPEHLIVEVVAEARVRSSLFDDHVGDVFILVVQRSYDLIQCAHHHHSVRLPAGYDLIQCAHHHHSVRVFML